MTPNIPLAVRNVIAEYRRFLDEPLRRQFEDHLEAAKVVVRGPYVTLAREFERGATLRALAEAGNAHGAGTGDDFGWSARPSHGPLPEGGHRGAAPRRPGARSRHARWRPRVRDPGRPGRLDHRAGLRAGGQCSPTGAGRFSATRMPVRPRSWRSIASACAKPGERVGLLTAMAIPRPVRDQLFVETREGRARVYLRGAATALTVWLSVLGLLEAPGSQPAMRKSSSAMTGVWSDGRSRLRGSLSIRQEVQASASAFEPRIRSMRRP